LNSEGEERIDELYEFIKKNYVETSADQHYKDSREFLVYITKFHDAFIKVRSEFRFYIETNQISNKEDKQKIFKYALYSNSDYNARKLEFRQYCNEFLKEDRDEYSVVRKIIDIYKIINDNNNLNLKHFEELEQIKDYLEFYLTGDEETMCKNADEDEIAEFKHLKELSLAVNRFMRNRNNQPIQPIQPKHV
jgi:hypothetical protein